MIEKRIVVDFYFDRKDSPVDIEARLSRAREIFSEHGGTFTEMKGKQTKNGIILKRFKAKIPDDQYTKHHGFDSKLNAQWPKGCGAGYVGDDE